MEIGQFNTINTSMADFSKVLAQNGTQIGKFGDFPTGKVLEGHIQVDMPKWSEIESDAELKNDLDALSVKSNENIDKTSADNFYKSFSNALNNGIQDVNNLQRTAEDAKEIFASGGNIDVHTVMIAAQKAEMGLEMATQVRNKILNAYKEVIKMQF